MKGFNSLYSNCCIPFSQLLYSSFYAKMIISKSSIVTGTAKIDHVSAKESPIFACLLYHNLVTIYTTATKSSPLLQKLMGFLLQLTEMK